MVHVEYAQKACSTSVFDCNSSLDSATLSLCRDVLSLHAIACKAYSIHFCKIVFLCMLYNIIRMINYI